MLHAFRKLRHFYNIPLTFQSLVPGEQGEQDVRVVRWVRVRVGMGRGRRRVVQMVQQSRRCCRSTLVYGSTHLCRTPPARVAEYPGVLDWSCRRGSPHTRHRHECSTCHRENEIDLQVLCNFNEKDRICRVGQDRQNMMVRIGQDGIGYDIDM